MELYAAKKKEIEERSRKRRDREISDLKKVLSAPEGRRFLWRVMGEAGIFRTSATGQTNTTFVNEGRRQIGLMILADIMEAKAEAFTQMQREQASDSKAESKGNE